MTAKPTLLLSVDINANAQQFFKAGRALPLRPGMSDVYFLGNCNGVVYLDAEVPHRRFHLLMPK